MPDAASSAPVSRRRFLLGAGAAGALAIGGIAACGGPAGPDDATSSSAPPDTTTTALPGDGIPPVADDRRIVALGEEFLLADLLVLGVRPVASTATLAGQGFVGLEGLEAHGVEALANSETSVEELATFRPDLVIAQEWVFDHVPRATLEAVAEVLVVPLGDLERLRAVAAAFGREDEAERLIDELDEASATAAAELGAVDRRVSVATVYGGPSLAVWVDGPVEVPAALASMGFTLVPGPADVEASNGRAYLSLEQIGLLDAPDLVMLQTGGVEGEQVALDAVTANPLWERLPAVRSDRVVTLDRLGYPGIAGRRRLVDDLASALAR